MLKTISFKANEELEEQIEAAAKKANCAKSDIIRVAIEWYLSRDDRQRNMQTIMETLDEVKREVVRTRAVVLRVCDPERTTLTDTLLERAAEDARAYLDERK